MSPFSSTYLAKLQDLKLWQGNRDALLQKQIQQSSDTNISNCETIESVSELGSSRYNCFLKNQSVDWDKKRITSTKPFEQLLEEKLTEEQPLTTQNKPKKPFLKKGSGLSRYKSSHNPVRTKPDKSKKSAAKNVSCIPKLTKIKNPEVNTNTFPGFLKNTSVESNGITSKATWCDIAINNKKTIGDEEPRKENQWELKQNLNDHIEEKINEFSLRRILSNNSSVKRGLFSKKIDIEDIRQGNNVPSTRTVFENAVEKELKIFETLEERVEHSSFSSTNSSIIRLLSSTPNKLKSPIGITSPTIKKHRLLQKSPPDQNCKLEELNVHFDDLQQKKNIINDENILHDFLNNLKQIVEDKLIQVDLSSSVPVEQECSPYSSLPEQEKWQTCYSVQQVKSPNVTLFNQDDWTDPDTFSPSSTSIYTDVENTFRNNKVDAATSTVFNETIDQIVQISTECEHCEQLKIKLNKLLGEVPDIQAEKAKVCDFAKDLEEKRDQLSKEIVNLKKKYEEDINDLRVELNSEKKRYLKEKAVFDMYIRDSRPTKREREEIINLKKELSDIKELAKLKETKNGATQARLRNQIKYLEKEKDELKTVITNLQKENSKLNALKKVKRPSEAKMFQTINKNLTRLTVETLKNQVVIQDGSGSSLNSKESNKILGNVEEEFDNNEHNLSSSKLANGKTITDGTLEKSSNKIFHSEIEKQYEDTFGHYGNHLKNTGQQNGSLNDSKRGKIEKIYPDASKEIKYSNGNTKTISPDGNLIIIQYYNGDIKEANLLDNTLKYFYAENSTWHTQFGDGSELLEYVNGQKERKYKDGKKEVICSDGTFLTHLPDGSEEVLYPDGSKMIRNPTGEKILLLPNGQKEVHTKEHQRREYPDGTVRIVYLDGTQETRYASGRLRIKDANGILLMDSEGI